MTRRKQTLAAQLEALVKEHDLTALSIGIICHTERTGTFFNAYAHGLTAVGTSSVSDTPALAIASAIEALNVKRAVVTLDVPQLEAA